MIDEKWLQLVEHVSKVAVHADFEMRLFKGEVSLQGEIGKIIQVLSALDSKYRDTSQVSPGQGIATGLVKVWWRK